VGSSSPLGSDTMGGWATEADDCACAEAGGGVGREEGDWCSRSPSHSREDGLHLRGWTRGWKLWAAGGPTKEKTTSLCRERYIYEALVEFEA